MIYIIAYVSLENLFIKLDIKDHKFYAKYIIEATGELNMKVNNLESKHSTFMNV